MTRTHHRAAAAGAAALLALALGGCGSAPTDASEEEFCEVVNDTAPFEDVEPDDAGAFVEALQEWAGEVEEVGTPEGIPDDAREGFEIQLDVIEGLDPGDFYSTDDLDRLEDDLSADEQEKVDAYTDYEDETCGDEPELEVPDPTSSG